jgi:raffinose/stachyose/melibiose transport system substrate-binding protein
MMKGMKRSAFAGNSLKKRWALVAVLILLLTVTPLFAGGQREAAADGETSQSEQKIELVWQTLTSDVRNRVMQEYIDAYEELHPNVSIKHVHQENDTYKTAIQVALASDDPPDIFFVWGDEYTGKLVRAGQVADMTEAFNTPWGETITEATKSQFTFGGRIYGVPRHMSSKYMYYNKEHFQQAGITELPETWAEFMDVTRQLKDAGFTPLTIGGKDSWQEAHWISLMNQKILGTEAIMDDYNLRDDPEDLFTDAGYVRALEMFKEIDDRGYFVENAHAIPRHASDALFYTEQASMIYAGTWAVSIWKGERANTAPPEFHDKWGMFRMPAISDGQGDQNVILGAADGYAISAKTPHFDTCMDFLQFTTNMENARKWAEIGNLSSVEGAVTPDIVSEELAWIAEDVAKASGMVGWMDTTMEASVVKVYLDGMVSVLAGDKSPTQVMEEVAAQARKVQDERGAIVY